MPRYTKQYLEYLREYNGIRQYYLFTIIICENNGIIKEHVVLRDIKENPSLISYNLLTLAEKIMQSKPRFDENFDELVKSIIKDARVVVSGSVTQ